jgi:phosphatidylglycerophosphate synthase
MSFAGRKERLRMTSKPREEWWSRVFATPVAYGILTIVADWRVITPNRLTILSFALTIGTALLIAVGDSHSLILAALILQIAYIIDCMDGQLARYRDVPSELGSLLDKWSDFVKFPFVIAALTLHASDGYPGTTPVTLGLIAIFMIGYQPYLKLIASSECSVGSWNVLTGKDFLRRNLRFFLFEEAQWYLIVSVCLLMNRPMPALVFLVATQSVVALCQTIWVFWSVMQARNVQTDDLKTSHSSFAEGND